MSGNEKPVGTKVKLPPPRTDLDLSRQMTEEKIENFFHRGGTFEKIPGCLREDVQVWERLHARRTKEIEEELALLGESAPPAIAMAEGGKLLREKEDIEKNPAFVWIAELYGNAVRRYLESTQRKIRSGSRGLPCD